MAPIGCTNHHSYVDGMVPGKTMKSSTNRGNRPRNHTKPWLLEGGYNLTIYGIIYVTEWGLLTFASLTPATRAVAEPPEGKIYSKAELTPFELDFSSFRMLASHDKVAWKGERSDRKT